MWNGAKSGFCTAAILAMAFSFVPVTATAEEGAEETSVLRLFFQEEEIITTASKTSEDARTAPATVDVFTAEDIRNMGARTLSDLLATLESVYVSAQTNSRTSVWFRGIRNRYNDKILLLFDGIPRRDLVYEHASIDGYLPLTNIERVEIIRGPGSALYGTNAFAGIINIITKKPPEKAYLEVGGAAGDYSTTDDYIEGGYKNDTLGFYAYAHYFDTDGDGLDYQRHQLKQTLRWNPKEQYSGGFTLNVGDFTFRAEKIHYFHTYYSDWDVPVWRWKDEGYWYDDNYLSGVYSHRFGQRAGIKVTAYYQDYRARNYWREWIYGQQGPYSTPDDVNANIDVFKTGRRFGGEIQGDFMAGEKNQMVAGMTYERENLRQVEDLYYYVHSGDTARPFYIDPVTLNTWALYLQDTYKPSNWATVTAGLRADHHQIFGWKLSPRVGVSFHPGKKFVAKVLYGEAFRAPSSREFFTVDLYGSFPPGNTSLEPESIKTAEAAFQYTFSSYIEGHLLFYHEKTDNAIFSEHNLPYSNHPGEAISGLETGVKMAWPNRVTAYANYSYTKTDLYNVPHNLAHAGVNAPLGEHWNLNANAIYVGRRLRDPADMYYYDKTRAPYRRPDVSSYVVVNATVRLFKIWRGLEFSASVYNLFDENYYDATYEPTKYYDLKGSNRTFLIRASYRF